MSMLQLETPPSTIRHPSNAVCRSSFGHGFRFSVSREYVGRKFSIPDNGRMVVFIVSEMCTKEADKGHVLRGTERMREKGTDGAGKRLIVRYVRREGGLHEGEVLWAPVWRREGGGETVGTPLELSEFRSSSSVNAANFVPGIESSDGCKRRCLQRFFRL